MQILLLLVIIAGKLDDPGSRPPAAATQKLDDSAGWPPRDLSVAMRPPTPEPGLPSKPEPSKPPAPAPPKPPAARPRLWQLADRSGQRWQHADPNWLKQWVAQRNAAIVPQYTAPVLQFGSPCANGACPR